MEIDILNTVESSIKSNEIEGLKQFSTMGPAKLRKLGLGPVNSRSRFAIVSSQDTMQSRTALHCVTGHLFSS